MARNLVACAFVALIWLVAAPTAHAMYSPTLGCFINRDPGLEPAPKSESGPVLHQRYRADVVHPMSVGHIAPRPHGGRGYHDGMSLYASYFVPNGLDPSGLAWILCIYSSTAEGQPNPFSYNDVGMSDGHAGLMTMDDDSYQSTTYGLWPDGHEGITNAGLSNGSGSDVRINYAGDSGSIYQYVFCICITDEQKRRFDAEVNKNWTHSGTNNCASFASEVFEATTGIDVDADDIMGFETPRELGEHIRELNGNPPQSQCCDSSGGSSSSK